MRYGVPFSECFVEGNLVDLAEQELIKASELLEQRSSGAATQEQWRELKYKLACLYEKSEREEDARMVFSEIFSEDAEYKDVADRVWGS